MREMGETLRATFGRVFRLENRRRARRRGTLEKGIVAGRTVTMYLPPGYQDHPEQRYPVLYMQDGQNLFEAERAFAGQPWHLDAAADDVIGHRLAEPIIIAGIDHMGDGRIDEYTPTRDASRKAGGRANDYGRLLLEDVKPVIDQTYRTIPDRTGIGGSSLGGLLALYLGLWRPDVFSRVAAMSPSVWWHNKAVLRFVDEYTAPSRPRLWIDIGGREGAEALAGVRALRDRLRAKGWADSELHFEEERRADHSERSWGRRAPRMLEFLFPAI